MDKELVSKIISIIDLEFDVLFFNHLIEESDINEIYKKIIKKLDILK